MKITIFGITFALTVTNNWHHHDYEHWIEFIQEEKTGKWLRNKRTCKTCGWTQLRDASL